MSLSLADAFTLANIAVSLIIVWFAVLNYKRTRWFLYGIFALTWGAWVAIYAFVLAADPANYNSVWFGQAIIRPLNFASFGLVMLVMWYRWRNDHR